MLYLGLAVGRQDFGPALHRGVVIFEVLLDLLHRVGATVGGGVQGLTWSIEGTS